MQSKLGSYLVQIFRKSLLNCRYTLYNSNLTPGIHFNTVSPSNLVANSNRFDIILVKVNELTYTIMKLLLRNVTNFIFLRYISFKNLRSVLYMGFNQSTTYKFTSQLSTFIVKNNLNYSLSHNRFTQTQTSAFQLGIFLIKVVKY